MKDFLLEALLTINETTVLFALTPPMERRVVIDGFFCLTVLVKVEKYGSSEDEVESL